MRKVTATITIYEPHETKRHPTLDFEYDNDRWEVQIESERYRSQATLPQGATAFDTQGEIGVLIMRAAEEAVK